MTKADNPKPAPPLLLQRFFPFRMAVLAEEISNAVGEIYTERFDLTRQEWRILATLGERQEMATSGIGRTTTLDKMQVSRAVRRLEKRKLIERRDVSHDRRTKSVMITAAGLSLYRQIAPLALERETAILAGLPSGDRVALDRIMSQLMDHLAEPR